MTNAQTAAENASPILRRRGGPRRGGRGEKSRARGGAPKEMLKMKIDPAMCMKTNEEMTICPNQKTIFLHKSTIFYTKAREFGRKRRLFCQSSSVGNEHLSSKCRISRAGATRRPYRGGTEVYSSPSRAGCGGGHPSCPGEWAASSRPGSDAVSPSMMTRLAATTDRSRKNHGRVIILKPASPML